MNVLITGCAGLLGSRMVDWLIKNQHDVKVVGIDDLSGGYSENITQKIHRWYKLDISEPESSELSEIFDRHKPDIVYHFAAYAAEGLSPFIRQFNYTNNLVATAGIINNCIRHDVSKLIFTSSMAVYGDALPPFEESMPRKPVDPYGVAKSACERDIEIASEQHGLDYVILRPHNVYGIKQNIWDRYRNVLGIWMNNYINNKPITIYGDGNQRRAFSYIDDCLEPMWKAAIRNEASGQIINLGGITDTSINDAADILIDVMGGGEKLFLEKRHEVDYAWSTQDKSVEFLDYEDKTPLKEGLSAMWEWAKAQPTREVQDMDYEITKGIYDFWKCPTTHKT